MPGENRPLVIREVTHGFDQTQPRARPARRTARSVAIVQGFARGGAYTLALPEVGVILGQRIGCCGTQQRTHDVDHLQVIGHCTTRGQFSRALLELGQRTPDARITVGLSNLQQRPHLHQEAAVIADVVDHRQALVAQPAQAAPELLQPHHR